MGKDDIYCVLPPPRAFCRRNVGIGIVHATDFGEEGSIFSFDRLTRYWANGADDIPSRVSTDLQQEEEP
jgi:hypothetical protein